MSDEEEFVDPLTDPSNGSDCQEGESEETSKALSRISLSAPTAPTTSGLLTQRLSWVLQFSE